MPTLTHTPPRPARKHVLRSVAGLAVGALLLTGCLAGAAQSFLDRANQLRASSGVAALQHHPALEGKAQRWAETLAARGSLGHSDLGDDLSGTSWRRLAENVGSASATGDWTLRIHEMFVRSATHRANLTDGRFTHMGVGIASGGGKVYVVEVFGQA